MIMAATLSEPVRADNTLHLRRQAVELLRSVRAVGRRRATFLGHLRNPFNVRGDVVGRRALFTNRFGDFLDHSNGIATPFADLLDGRGETVILSESVTFHRETLPGFWFGWGYTFDPDQLLCGPTRGDSYSEYTVPCTLPEAIAKFRELAAQQDAGATRG